MDRRPSQTLSADPTAEGKSLKPNYNYLQKKLSHQIKDHVQIQSQLIKQVQTYRNCIHQLSQASTDLSETISKLTLHSVENFEWKKELMFVDEEQQEKHKNLGMALKQVVKFFTVLGKEMDSIDQTIGQEFDRPIYSQVDKFKEMSQIWEKDYEKDVKRLQTEIKHKEAEAATAGKTKSKDLSKLSNHLQELSIKMNHLERFQFERLEQVHNTNHHQCLLLAHHLQRLLKAEIQSYKAIYYQDASVKNASGRKSKPSLNVKTPIRSVENSPMPSPSTPAFLRPKSTKSQPATPTAGSFLDETVADYYGGTPLPPPRRKQSADWPDSPIPNPRKSSYQPVDNTPLVPSNPHRKTMLLPNGADKEVLEKVLEANFPDRSMIYSAYSPIKENLPEQTQMYSFAYPESPFKQKQRAKSIFEPQLNTPDQETQLMLVTYDYEPTAADDLNVSVGDIIRVISIEGEWVYGMVMEEETENGEVVGYVPAESRGAFKVGWLPLSFVQDLSTGE